MLTRQDDSSGDGNANKVRTRRLGRTALDVSEIGLGLWGMSGWSGSDNATSAAVLRMATDLGCRFFDTAWAYGDGNSDQLLGALNAERAAARIVMASKVPPMNQHWPARADDSFDDVFPAGYVNDTVDRIRRALGVDTVPLLQLHVWDDHWARDPAFSRLIEELKTSGAILHFGLSLNRWEPWNGLVAIGTGLVDVVQVIYNIFDQAPEDELFPACLAADVGVIARVPLDEGSLGGAMTLETRFPESDWRSKYFGPENLPATISHVAELREVLPAGMTLAELAIRFVLSDARVSTTIVGVRSAAHLQENLAASAAGPLPDDLLSSLRRYRWDRVPAAWSD